MVPSWCRCLFASAEAAPAGGSSSPPPPATPPSCPPSGDALRFLSALSLLPSAPTPAVLFSPVWCARAPAPAPPPPPATIRCRFAALARADGLPHSGRAMLGLDVQRSVGMKMSCASASDELQSLRRWTGRSIASLQRALRSAVGCGRPGHAPFRRSCSEAAAPEARARSHGASRPDPSAPVGLASAARRRPCRWDCAERWIQA